jgi:hypothetical protein
LQFSITSAIFNFTLAIQFHFCKEAFMAKGSDDNKASGKGGNGGQGGGGNPGLGGGDGGGGNPGPGGGGDDHGGHGEKITFLVNEKPVSVTDEKQTGLSIKQAAIAQGVQIQLDFVLSIERGGGKTDLIGDDEKVESATAIIPQ